MKVFMLNMSCYFDSFLIEIQRLSTAILLKDRFDIVVHASSFSPLIDVICPRRFLIECVDAK